MVSARRLVGLVVIVIGIVLAALPYTGLTSEAVTIPVGSNAGGSTLALTPGNFGGGMLKVSWSGAGSGTVVSIYSCPNDNACSGSYSIPQLSLVASGSGSSGTVTASITGGVTYLLTENGTSGGLSATADVVGIGVLSVLGIVVAIVGVVLVALPGPRGAAKPSDTDEPAPSEDEVMLAAPTTKPLIEPIAAPGQRTAPAPTAPPTSADEDDIYQAPVVEAHDDAVGQSTAVAKGGSGRQPIKCSNCGTMNEPWITNCRWCKRSLSSTG